jgi:hypothetical protein
MQLPDEWAGGWALAGSVRIMRAARLMDGARPWAEWDHKRQKKQQSSNPDVHDDEQHDRPLHCLVIRRRFFIINIQK